LITVDPKEKPFDETYNKFTLLSEKVGDFVYTEKDLSQIKVFMEQYYKRKIIVKPAEQLVDVINSTIEKEKMSRKSVGVALLAVIGFLIFSIALYSIYFIFSILLDIMEWWMLAILFMMAIVPCALIIAYWIAKGDY
jgi:ABC-type multidrug transport system permease subunit